MNRLSLSMVLVLGMACDGDRGIRQAPYAVLAQGTPVDMDGDGYAGTIDCDDVDADVHPGAAEPCDQVDNDCDGAVDEGPEPCPLRPTLARLVLGR